jgi:hypothetical protein
MIARLQVEGTKQAEQAFFKEAPATKAIVMQLATKAKPASTKSSGSNEVKGRSIPEKVVQKPIITASVLKIKNDPVKVSVKPKIKDIIATPSLEQVTHHGSKDSSTDIATSSEVTDKLAHSNNEIPHATTINPVHKNMAVAVTYEEQLLKGQNMESTGLSDDEIMELADWTLWDNELTEDVSEPPDTEGNNSRVSSELPAVDTGALADLDIFHHIVNGENAEISNVNYLGAPLIKSLFEIVELTEPTEYFQPIPVHLEPQIIRTELINSASLETVLAETLGDQAEPPVFSSIEPTKAEGVLELFEAIVLAVNNLAERPESEVLGPIQEEIQKLCVELFTHIGIISDDKIVHRFIEVIKQSLFEVARKTTPLNLSELSGLGTHEHKFRHNFSPVKLTKVIKQKFQLHVRLGKYVLEVSAN